MRNLEHLSQPIDVLYHARRECFGLEQPTCGELRERALFTLFFPKLIFHLEKGHPIDMTRNAS